MSAIKDYRSAKESGAIELARSGRGIEIKVTNTITETIKYEETKTHVFADAKEFRDFIAAERVRMDGVFADYEAQLVDMEALP